MNTKETQELTNTSFPKGKNKTRRNTKMAKEKMGNGNKTIPKAPKMGGKGKGKGGKKGC